MTAITIHSPAIDPHTYASTIVVDDWGIAGWINLDVKIHGEGRNGKGKKRVLAQITREAAEELLEALVKVLI